MLIPDLPPIEIMQPIAIENRCVVAASAYYDLPPELIVAVRIQEAGTIGRTSENTNKSRDMGPMQINTIHLEEFSRHGIHERDLIENECTNLFAGAYRLRVELNRASDFWEGVGNYHSATAVHHYSYRRHIADRLRKLYANYQPYVKWLREEAVKLRARYVPAEGNPQ